MLIDSHAHIAYGKDLDTAKIISEMQNDGLVSIVTIGTNVKDSLAAVKMAEENENVYAVIGMHPEDIASFDSASIETLRELARSPKVVAIGEIGLDYHWEQGNKNEQKAMFEAMLELATQTDLPVCIHSRDAASDMYDILSKFAPRLKRKGVMHCYSDGAEYVKKYLDLGFFISFAGNVTFKKYDRSFLKEIPLDRILVETDCPFLAPEPLRGQVNEPKNVKYTAAFLAREYGVSEEEFFEQTVKNTKRLYYKIK